MNSPGKAFIRTFIGMVLLVAVIGAGKWILNRHAASAPLGGVAGASSEYSTQAMAQVQAMLAQQAAFARQAGLGQQQATPAAAEALVSPPKLSILQESKLSVHLVLTLPDGQPVDQVISLQPSERFQPTAAESAALARQDRQVFGAKLAVDKSQDGEHIVLRYFVPSTTLPIELRERLYGKLPGTAGIHLFSAAWAQSSNMGFWTGVQTGSQIGQSFKWGSAVKGAQKLASNAEKVGHALDTADQFSKWMATLDSLENCARNPTQTVTQNAYKQDPGYQQRTLDAIGQARSEVQQATGLSYVNQEANVAMQLTKAPGLASQLGSAMYKWNDSALTDIGNGLVADAAKIVDCDMAPPPPEKGDGTITYHLHREGFWGIDVDDQLVKVTVHVSSPPIAPPPGFVAFNIDGQGEFKGKIVSQQGNNCTGVAEVHGSGSDKYLHLTGGAASGSCSGISFDYGGRNANFTCDFAGVDPINGGKYEVQAAGEFGPWTVCSLDLKPQQK